MSASAVMPILIAQNIQVAWKNYIGLAYLGEYDARNHLEHELKMFLPKLLRILDDKTGCEREPL